MMLGYFFSKFVTMASRYGRLASEVPVQNEMDTGAFSSSTLSAALLRECASAEDPPVEVEQEADAASIKQAFQVLYRTEDADTALNMIFKLAGIRLDVSRFSLLEPAKDGSRLLQTIHWEADGQAKLPDQISLDLMRYVPRILDRDGLFGKDSRKDCKHFAVTGEGIMVFES